MFDVITFFWRCRYTIDYRDPVAQSRNKGIVKTIESVANIKRSGPFGEGQNPERA
jgi:hypothetical protein